MDGLQLGDAVLVVPRDGGAVLDGVTEVVDRHVVAELLAGHLLALDERCAGEPHERCVGKGLAHVQRQRVVLAAMCFVCDHDRSEEHTSELQSLMRISYAVFCLKKKTKKTMTK